MTVSFQSAAGRQMSRWLGITATSFDGCPCTVQAQNDPSLSTFLVSDGYFIQVGEGMRASSQQVLRMIFSQGSRHVKSCVSPARCGSPNHKSSDKEAMKNFWHCEKKRCSDRSIDGRGPNEQLARKWLSSRLSCSFRRV